MGETESKSTNWLDKYADEIADIFGVLFVLSISFLPFLYLIGFFPETGIPTKIFYFILCVVAVGIPLLLLTLKFAKREKIGEEKESVKVSYVLNQWSIGTLKAINAPKDVIKSLEEILKKTNDNSINDAQENADIIANSEHLLNRHKFSKKSLLEEMEKKLGKVRVQETGELVLKYTRREILEETDDNNSVTTSDNSVSNSLPNET